jgi:hypothetical protein
MGVDDQSLANWLAIRHVCHEHEHYFSITAYGQAP